MTIQLPTSPLSETSVTCFGNISQPASPSIAAMSRSAACTAAAICGSRRNRNRCSPPDLLRHGTSGSLCRSTCSTTLRRFSEYSSMSTHPHLQVPSLQIGMTPSGFSPARCCCHSSSVTGSRTVSATFLMCHLGLPGSWYGVPCVPCASLPANSATMRSAIVMPGALSLAPPRLSSRSGASATFKRSYHSSSFIGGSATPSSARARFPNSSVTLKVAGATISGHGHRWIFAIANNRAWAGDRASARCRWAADRRPWLAFARRIV